jgi:hypothetical protein
MRLTFIPALLSLLLLTSCGRDSSSPFDVYRTSTAEKAQAPQEQAPQEQAPQEQGPQLPGFFDREPAKSFPPEVQGPKKPCSLRSSKSSDIGRRL